MNDSIITGRMHPHSVCPIHDEFLDDETGLCDHCERENGLRDCPSCGGDGVIVSRHPLWGQRHCPDPEIEEVCSTCSGEGVVDFPESDYAERLRDFLG